MTDSNPRGPAEQAAADWLSRLSGLLAGILMFISCAVMVLMVLHIVADVLLRYFFNQPLVSTIEIVTHWYMVALAFLPLGYVQWHREHLTVEAFTTTLPPSALRVLDVFVQSLCLGLLVLFAYQTTLAAIDKTQIREALEGMWFEVPVWPTRWFLPLGLGIMALCLVAQGVGRGAATRRHASDVPAAPVESGKERS